MMQIENAESLWFRLRPFGRAETDRHGVLLAVSLAVAVLLAVPVLEAQEEYSPGTEQEDPVEKVDPDDDSGERAEAKDTKKGPSFIPIPIFITEPAIGYGLGGAVGYFHPTKGDQNAGSLAPAITPDTAVKVGRRQKVPPTATSSGRRTASGSESTLRKVRRTQFSMFKVGHAW